MLRRLLAVAGLVCFVSGPVFANTVASHDVGARKSAAVAGAYLSIDLGGKGAKRRGGLRLQMQHDYRDGPAPRAPVHTSDTAEIRLVGPAQPTLYLGGRAVTGEEARKQQALSPVGTAVTLAVVAGVVVGGLLLLSAVRDSGGE